MEIELDPPAGITGFPLGQCRLAKVDHAVAGCLGWGDDAQILHYPVPTQPGQQVYPEDGARWPLTWNRVDDAICIHDSEAGWTRHFAAPPRGDALMRPITALTRCEAGVDGDPVAAGVADLGRKTCLVVQSRCGIRCGPGAHP